MSKDIEIIEIPDPFSCARGYIAFIGHRPIPSKGRSHRTYNKSNADMTFGECAFLSREVCQKNAEWYIHTHMEIEEE